MPEPRPVELMIVGAPKAGTTALKSYLAQHPGVCTHPHREMQFFASDDRYAQGYPASHALYFRGARPTQLLCGKSVATMYSPVALARLRHHNPRVQVVIVLRNPVDRAYSEFWYARRRGWEPLPSFEVAIRAGADRFRGDNARRQRCEYLERSSYAPHLAAVLSCFPREQVHVLMLEDIARDAVGVCQSLFRLFPVLDPRFTPDTGRRENAAALPRSEQLLRVTASGDAAPRVRRLFRQLIPPAARQPIKDLIQRLNERQFTPPPLSPTTRAELVLRFHDSNRRLEDLLGRDLSGWDHCDAAPARRSAQVPAA